METKVHDKASGDALELPPESCNGIVLNLPHEQYLKGPGLSQSGLKTLRKTPWHFAATHLLPLPEWLVDDDSDERVDTSTPMFAGTLCHGATLEGGAFDERYVVGPSNVDKRTKAWKEFVASHQSQVVITHRQRETAFAQARSLHAHPVVADIMDGAEVEVSAYAIDPTTGVLMRCRADVANRKFGPPNAPAAMLLDVKTTSDLSDEALSRTVLNYGYHFQDAWYTDVFSRAAGMPVAGFVFAFVENAYPFACRVFQLDDITRAIARRENRAALDLYARCQAERHWPGYNDDVGLIGLPAWALRGEL